MNKIISLCLLFLGMVFFTPNISFAVCTEADIHVKIVRFQEKLILIVKNNPEKISEISKVVQERLPELQSVASLEPFCSFYDEMLKKIN